MIFRKEQYNQEISKYKLLSSTAGVGSLITTRAGVSVLISDINKWYIISETNKAINMINRISGDDDNYEKIQEYIWEEYGFEILDDQRFIEFIKIEKRLPNLIVLIKIPSLSLNEGFNTIDINENPIINFLKGKNKDVRGANFSIPATHFPKWFKSRKGVLKRYNEWRKEWLSKKENHIDRFFVPPRDANDPLEENGKLRSYKYKDAEGNEKYQINYARLEQLNIVLICPNGHLNDIPWPKYLWWKSLSKEDRVNYNVEDLNNIFVEAEKFKECCQKPDLRWTESKTKSEGYASVYLHCENCKAGLRESKVNLEGISNFKPFCVGEKPWEMKIGFKSNENIPREKCHSNISGDQKSEQMKFALVTGNSVYYANTFSSIYIPMKYIDSLDSTFRSIIELLLKRYEIIHQNRGADYTKKDFCKEYISKEKLYDEYKNEIDQYPDFISSVKNMFLESQKNEEDDFHQEYRKQEYDCFVENSKINESGLIFSERIVSKKISEYFSKIKQIEELQFSIIQLDFSRVQPKERYKDEGTWKSSRGMNTYSCSDEDVYCLPSNSSWGEGILFLFNDDKITEWKDRNTELLLSRIENLVKDHEGFDITRYQREKIKENPLKHIMIHTFSHLLMKELEFSCGYPTASMKERLYISDEMAGLLIYTADGSEGSMGGLIWQSQEDRMAKIILDGLSRGIDCSSDPLCWESDETGLGGLNLAACFSCALISETSCEERNLGLDRRLLIDPEFGFFKDLLYKQK